MIELSKNPTRREIERLAALPASDTLVLSEYDVSKLARLLLIALDDLKDKTCELLDLKSEVGDL